MLNAKTFTHIEKLNNTLFTHSVTEFVVCKNL